MPGFLNSSDQEKILKELSLEFKDEETLNALSIWESIWKEYKIKYQFSYNELNKSIYFHIKDKFIDLIKQGFSIKYFIYLRNLIKQFNKVRGIFETLKNFKHYNQFSSTIFELICANYINKNKQIIKFSPKVIKNAKERTPDFSYLDKSSIVSQLSKNSLI